MAKGNDINVCTFNGRLTADAKFYASKKEDAKTGLGRFSIAVNVVERDAQGNRTEDPVFINITHPMMSEKLVPYLTKGTAVTVSGMMVNDSYTDKDGKKISRLALRISSLQLQSGKPAEKASAPAGQAPAQAPTAAPAPAAEDDDPFGFDN